MHNEHIKVCITIRSWLPSNVAVQGPCTISGRDLEPARLTYALSKLALSSISQT